MVQDLEKADRYLKNALQYFEKMYYKAGYSLGIAEGISEHLKDNLTPGCYSEVAKEIILEVL